MAILFSFGLCGDNEVWLGESLKKILIVFTENAEMIRYIKL